MQADPERMQEHNVTLLSVMEATADALDVGMLKFSTAVSKSAPAASSTRRNQRLGVRHILPER